MLFFHTEIAAYQILHQHTPITFLPLISRANSFDGEKAYAWQQAGNRFASMVLLSFKNNEKRKQIPYFSQTEV